jgi:hypothetical protein
MAMTHVLTHSRIALASILLACAGVAQAQGPLPAADYGATKDRIHAEYKAAKAACDRLSGNAEDVCTVEAKGKEKVALADLEHRRTGSADDARKLALARADAAYELAKERCDDLKGNDRDVCMKEAKATEVRMKGDAKATTESAQARNEMAEDRRDADYKVAIERCDSLSGAAKSDCTAAAKTQFGK